MTTSEKRVHPRSQYFLLKEDGHPLPVYAFREKEDLAATPALLLDMSEGGVQVLTTASDAPEDEAYDLEIAHSEELGHLLKHIRVAKAWQRPDGVNVRTGFAFQDSAEVQALLSRRLSEAEHHLLRCVLHPLGQ